MPFMHGDPNLSGVGTPVGGNASDLGFSNSAVQWIRACSLVIADQSGEGIELANQDVMLRIRFSVTYQNTPTPATLSARVYNLSPTTIQKIIGLASGDPPTDAGIVPVTAAHVTLKAGYVENLGTLFEGQIYQMRVGKESSTDSYLDIFAADGHFAQTYTLVNDTFAAGYKSEDVWNRVGQRMKQWAVTTGAPPSNLSRNASPRGKVIFGQARDTLNDLAASHGFDWNIIGGQLHGLPKFGYNPGSVVLVNSLTGMINPPPEQTEDGIKVHVLLNPAIRWGTRVQINNGDIARLIFQNAGLTVPTNQGDASKGRASVPSTNINGTNVDSPSEAFTSADGQYVVLWAEHNGDTRGNEWVTKFSCLSIDPTTVASVATGIASRFKEVLPRPLQGS